MSTVTPEFIDKYNQVLDLLNRAGEKIDRTAAANELAWAESKAEAARSKAEFDRRAAEWEEQHRKSREDWDRRMAESKAEWEERYRKKAEEDKKYKEEKAEEDRKYRAEQKKLDRRLGLQEDRYGQFVESFVRNQLVRLLNERGIEVKRFLSNVECQWGDGSKREFDAIVINGDTVVLVEVKSTLNKHDVEYFLDKMRLVREQFWEYQDKKIIGAMAFIHAAGDAEKRAQDVGFFTILATASSACITNSPMFKVKEF